MYVHSFTHNTLTLMVRTYNNDIEAQIIVRTYKGVGSCPTNTKTYYALRSIQIILQLFHRRSYSRGLKNIWIFGSPLSGSGIRIVNLLRSYSHNHVNSKSLYVCTYMCGLGQAF